MDLECMKMELPPTTKIRRRICRPRRKINPKLPISEDDSVVLMKLSMGVKLDVRPKFTNSGYSMYFDYYFGDICVTNSVKRLLYRGRIVTEFAGDTFVAVINVPLVRLSDSH